MAKTQEEERLEHAVQEALDATAQNANVAEFRTGNKAMTSVAEQMVGIANVIRGVHQELDKLEADVIARIGVIRKTLGGKA